MQVYVITFDGDTTKTVGPYTVADRYEAKRVMQNAQAEFGVVISGPRARSADHYYRSGGRMLRSALRHAWEGQEKLTSFYASANSIARAVALKPAPGLPCGCQNAGAHRCGLKSLQKLLRLS